jgi:hypothetical protein
LTACGRATAGLRLPSTVRGAAARGMKISVALSWPAGLAFAMSVNSRPNWTSQILLEAGKCHSDEIIFQFSFPNRNNRQ